MTKTNKESIRCAWNTLEEHAHQLRHTKITELFKTDPKRFDEFSLCVNDVLFDYSKQKITPEVLKDLIALAEASGLPEKIQALFAGERLNISENRPVLHTALRDFSSNPLWIDNHDVKEEILASLIKMEGLVEGFYTGEFQGLKGRFTDVVCFGIGGSELGPLLTTEALQQYQRPGIRFHFVSNCFGIQLANLFSRLHAGTTLFIVSSKTFTTPETLINARAAIDWMKSQFPDEQNFLERHFVAITAHPARAQAMGIPEEHILEFWDWVGGRYSVWSSVGFPLALSIGMDHFRAFLRGARSMDIHFYSEPFHRNLPVLMALIGIWNVNFLGTHTLAVLPYDNRLEKFPAYLQQLEMESNGKRVDLFGHPIQHATVPIIWGGVGCNVQHAFMQMLHQAEQIVPVDFLLPARGHPDFPEHHQLLFASCLSQSKALMEGVSTDDEAKNCPGDRPSSTLVYSDLTPQTLGSLIALYEHKVFTQGILWGINSFDQWGVELGKNLAKKIMTSMSSEEEIEKPGQNAFEEGSSRGLLQYFQKINYS